MRGGYRPGAGRPKVRAARKAVKSGKRRQRSQPEPAKAGPIGTTTPLDHMLSVMRDPAADPLRRDRMAIAAAPFCHARIDNRVGKKDLTEEAARTAGHGSDWADDLDFDGLAH